MRGALLACLVVVISCQDKSVIAVNTGPAVTIRIEPHTLLELSKGQTRVLTAALANTSNPVAIWSVSSLTIASVSPTGLVTAVDTGSAWIVAASMADLTARDSIPIKVGPASAGGILPAATLSFTQLLPYGETAPLDYDHVKGQVSAEVLYDTPTFDESFGGRLQLYLNSTLACDFGVVLGHGRATCVLNTAELISGVPKFPNGTYTPTVTLTSATRGLLASAKYRNITITN